MRLPTFAVLCCMLLATVVQAGPLVPGDVSTDAKWFGHVNVEKIHSLEIVQQFREKMDREGRFAEKMKDLTEKLGMNPAEDLLGVTLYATQYEGETGVVLFYVKKVDAKKMVAAFKEKYPDHKTSKCGDRTLYSWTAKCHHHEKKLTGTFANKNLIVIGSDENDVKAALAVLDGKKPGMEKDSPLLSIASKNSLFVSKALDVPDGYRETTRCPVLKKCTAASANWTERKGKIKGVYEFTTDKEETATGFKAIMDGMVAMAKMRTDKMEAVKKVMDGLKYKVKGKEVKITFQTTSDDLKAAIKEVMAKHHQKRECEKASEEKECEK